MFRYRYGSIRFVSVPWSGLVLAVICSMFLSACFKPGDQNGTRTSGEQSMAFGVIEVKSIGPNPRQFSTRLRFFDVIHVATQERTRVMVEPDAQIFLISLRPGHYEVIRMQMNAGPFRAEFSITMRFQIRANQLNYLGTWQLNVDTPRTQRMVRMEVTENSPNWEDIFEAHPNLQEQSVVHALPELATHQARMYVVAPMPKVKYFYR